MGKLIINIAREPKAPEQRKKILEFVENAFKQIDDCPFISKKMSLIRLLSAKLANIENPKSQADYMKEEVILKAKIMWLNLLKKENLYDR